MNKDIIYRCAGPRAIGNILDCFFGIFKDAARDSGYPTIELCRKELKFPQSGQLLKPCHVSGDANENDILVCDPQQLGCLNIFPDPLMMLPESGSRMPSST